MASKQTSFRVLMFPWLAHGHIFPFFELAKKLSHRYIHIYFCSTAINLDSIAKSLKKDSSDHNYDLSIELVELRLPPSPEIPPHYHTTKNIPPHLIPTLTTAFQTSISTFSDIITDLKPDLLIYDMLQPWSAKIASSQGIPSLLFVTSGSTSLSFFHHMYTHRTFETFPNQAIKFRDYERRELFAYAKTLRVIKDKEEGFAFGVFRLSCDIVLIKSCRGVEGNYIDHLSTLCGKKIVPTGPLVTSGDDYQSESGDLEIMNWLSERRQCSTLYISFGSENYLSKEQIGEIAKGLEMIMISNDVNFIWVVRSPVIGSEINDVVGGEDDELFPERFLERVKHRGMIVKKWAPQAAILAHPSVGGFMSHCGWSSITESIYFGVPVVAVPLKFDQPVNARWVVEAGVGVEVTRDESNGRFDGEGVANAVKEVINVEDSGERFRCRVRELSEKMKMEEEEAMDQVVEELSRICLKK